MFSGSGDGGRGAKTIGHLPVKVLHFAFDIEQQTLCFQGQRNFLSQLLASGRTRNDFFFVHFLLSFSFMIFSELIAISPEISWSLSNFSSCSTTPLLLSSTVRIGF